MFFLAEYINMFTVSALATTLFLGGWRAPAPISTIWPGANEGWWPLLWWVLKVFAFIFFFIWLRGPLPRLRYDQFMKLGWKVLIPVALAWILVVGFFRALRNESDGDLTGLFTGLALIVGAVLVALLVIDQFLAGRSTNDAESDEPAAAPFDPMAGGHPVPPLPWQQAEPVPVPTTREPIAVSEPSATTAQEVDRG
jgi:NADH-quinone oxidoreductase subunit H